MVIFISGLLGIATVDDGEVIPVTNTPPHPPPLPEPPPIGDIETTINDPSIDEPG
jgi:hypothetical protein